LLIDRAPQGHRPEHRLVVVGGIATIPPALAVDLHFRRGRVGALHRDRHLRSTPRLRHLQHPPLDDVHVHVVSRQPPQLLAQLTHPPLDGLDVFPARHPCLLTDQPPDPQAKTDPSCASSSSAINSRRGWMWTHTATRVIDSWRTRTT